MTCRGVWREGCRQDQFGRQVRDAGWFPGLADVAAAQPQPGLDGGNAFKVPLLARTLVAALRALTPEA